MKAQLTFAGKSVQVDFKAPLNIALPLRAGDQNPNCFYAPYMEVEPVRAGDFVGSTAEGGPLNFMNVKFNPHGNGTHTECVGHIAKKPYYISEQLQRFMHWGQLVSLYPQQMENGDRVITREALAQLWEAQSEACEAFIIRTLPNTAEKKQRVYSGSNPPYLAADAASFLVEKGITHLLLDLPSVDRAEDGGALAAHRAFWQYPDKPRETASITELIYVPNEIPDGYYLVQLQIANFELDASPSKPQLYGLELL